MVPGQMVKYLTPLVLTVLMCRTFVSYDGMIYIPSLLRGRLQILALMGCQYHHGQQ